MQSVHPQFARNALLWPFLFSILAGVLLVGLVPFQTLSFDVSIALRPQVRPPKLALIEINDEAVRKLGLPGGRIPRSVHARLLDRLRQDGAGPVFFDLSFNDPDPDPAEDAGFVDAIRRHGSVVVITKGETIWEQGMPRERVAPLLPALSTAGIPWGHAELPSTVVRLIPRDFAGQPYAVWRALDRVLVRPSSDADRAQERWLNFFGPPPGLGIPAWPLLSVLSSNGPASGAFRDCAVFVGQSLPTGNPGAVRDVFRSPYSRFGLGDSAGVAFHATAFQNLREGRALYRVPLGWQCLWASMWGMSCVAGLNALARFPRKYRFGAAGLATVLLAAVSLAIQWRWFWWWAWLAPAVVQPLLAAGLTRDQAGRARFAAFISYRRENHAAARLIQERLLRHGVTAFMDVTGLRAGRFDLQLLKQIEQASFFVLVLSHDSLAECTREHDWLLRELDHALKCGKVVVPVFLDGYTFGDPDRLPAHPSIQQLAAYQGIAVSHEDFDGAVLRLARLIQAR